MRSACAPSRSLKAQRAFQCNVVGFRPWFFIDFSAFKRLLLPFLAYVDCLSLLFLCCRKCVLFGASVVTNNTLLSGGC